MTTILDAFIFGAIGVILCYAGLAIETSIDPLAPWDFQVFFAAAGLAFVALGVAFLVYARGIIRATGRKAR